MPRARIASPKKSSRSSKAVTQVLPEETIVLPVKKVVPKRSAGLKKAVTPKATKKKTTATKPQIKKSVALAQATIPLVQNDIDTVTLQLEKMTEQKQKTQTSKTTGGALQCFVYGGSVCLLGVVALGLFLGFIVLPPLFNQQQPETLGAVQQNPTVAAQPSAQQAEPQQQQFGFYGTLLSKEKDILIVKELLNPLPLEKARTQNPKTYVVRVAPETEYTYQKPRAESDTSSPLFTPEKGIVDAIQPGMFIFVSTFDDTNTTETVKAAHVLYSEKSPFGQ